jgi:hypothetical protein
MELSWVNRRNCATTLFDRLTTPANQRFRSNPIKHITYSATQLDQLTPSPVEDFEYLKLRKKNLNALRAHRARDKSPSAHFDPTQHNAAQGKSKGLGKNPRWGIHYSKTHIDEIVIGIAPVTVSRTAVIRNVDPRAAAQ